MNLHWIFLVLGLICLGCVVAIGLCRGGKCEVDEHAEDYE